MVWHNGGFILYVFSPPNALDYFIYLVIVFAGSFCSFRDWYLNYKFRLCIVIVLLDVLWRSTVIERYAPFPYLMRDQTMLSCSQRFLCVAHRLSISIRTTTTTNAAQSKWTCSLLTFQFHVCVNHSMKGKFFKVHRSMKIGILLLNVLHNQNQPGSLEQCWTIFLVLTWITGLTTWVPDTRNWVQSSENK